MRVLWVEMRGRDVLTPVTPARAIG